MSFAIRSSFSFTSGLTRIVMVVLAVMESPPCVELYTLARFPAAAIAFYQGNTFTRQYVLT